MSQKKNNTTWKQKHTAEKLGLLVGWAFLIVIVVITWHWSRLALLLPTEPATDIVSEAQTPPTAYPLASEPALLGATQYLSSIDKAIAEGIQILNANQIPQLVTHSQVFKSLLDQGQAQFGHSVFEPLGKCSAAGLFANSWWQAQVSAVRQGVTESIPGGIQSHLDEYNINRAECLKQADPSANNVSANEKKQTVEKAL
jgi:hypothetical protein